jgi:hypothetical protein
MVIVDMEVRSPKETNMIDRKTKTLMALIALALWTIALRPFLPTPSAEAQTTAGPGAPAKQLKARYEFLDADKGGSEGIYQLKDKMDEMAGKGWHAKDVAITAEATVILMEKME